MRAELAQFGLLGETGRNQALTCGKIRRVSTVVNSLPQKGINNLATKRQKKHKPEFELPCHLLYAAGVVRSTSHALGISRASR